MSFLKNFTFGILLTRIFSLIHLRFLLNILNMFYLSLECYLSFGKHQPQNFIRNFLFYSPVIASLSYSIYFLLNMFLIKK
jgi:hypothetical protein